MDILLLACLSHVRTERQVKSNKPRNFFKIGAYHIILKGSLKIKTCNHIKKAAVLVLLFACTFSTCACTNLIRNVIIFRPIQITTKRNHLPYPH